MIIFIFWVRGEDDKLTRHRGRKGGTWELEPRISGSNIYILHPCCSLPPTDNLHLKPYLDGVSNSVEENWPLVSFCYVAGTRPVISQALAHVILLIQ